MKGDKPDKMGVAHFFKIPINHIVQTIKVNAIIIRTTLSNVNGLDIMQYYFKLDMFSS